MLRPSVIAAQLHNSPIDRRVNSAYQQGEHIVDWGWHAEAAALMANRAVDRGDLAGRAAQHVLEH